VSTAGRCARYFAVLSAAVLTAGLLLVGIAAPALAASGSVPVKGTVGLYGVSCPSATKCIAVGELQQPGTRGAMVTVTCGHASSPKLVSAANGLYAISCPSPTNCYAVGFNNSADGVVVHFAGATQSSLAVPLVDTFTGVACVSATSCYAVGTEHNKRALSW
jgi:hypothetical protein